MRVVFTQVTDVGKVTLPTVGCLDFFESEINKLNGKFFKETFDEVNGLWVCPGASEMTLLEE